MDGADISTMKETQRLHDLAKAREPLPQQPRKKSGLPTPEEYSDYDMDVNSDDDLPSDLDDEDLGDDMEDSEAEGSGTSSTLDDDLGDSDLDDQSDLNDAFDDLSDESDDDDEEEEEFRQRKKKQKESEADYETSGRSRWNAPPPKPEEDSVEVGRLPIKLPTGEIQTVEGSTRIALPPSKKKKVVVESESEEELLESEDDASDDGVEAERMASKKGRFGRMGVSEIVGMKGAKNAQKLDMAKEQIAQIGAEILAGGELIDIVSLWCPPTMTESDSAGAGSDSSFHICSTHSPFPRGGRRTSTRTQLYPRSRLLVPTRCLQGLDTRIPYS